MFLVNENMNYKTHAEGERDTDIIATNQNRFTKHQLESIPWMGRYLCVNIKYFKWMLWPYFKKRINNTSSCQNLLKMSKHTYERREDGARTHNHTWKPIKRAHSHTYRIRYGQIRSQNASTVHMLPLTCLYPEPNTRPDSLIRSVNQSMRPYILKMD